MLNKNTKEIVERRHARMRELMSERGDLLWIIAGCDAPDRKGYIRYVSDWRITDGTVYVVLPLEGEPAVIIKVGSQAYWAREECTIRDVHASVDETGELLNVLAKFDGGSGQIGMVGFQDVIAYSQGSRIVNSLSDSMQLRDVTKEMDALMIPSGEEDFRGAEEVHTALEKVLMRFKEELKVGRTEREVLAHCMHEMYYQGCYDGACRLSTADSGANRHPKHRTFEKEDIVRLYLEAAGPSGFWAELGGVFSFHEPPELVHKKFDTTVKAMEKVAGAMRPGARVDTLCDVSEEVFRADGWEITGRALWDAHGQGMCKHLPPYAWPGNEETLRENMIINQHPGVSTSDGLGFSLTNNYVVTKTGGKAVGDFRHIWHLL